MGVKKLATISLQWIPDPYGTVTRQILKVCDRVNLASNLEPEKELNTSDPWKFKSQLKSCLGLYFKVVSEIIYSLPASLFMVEAFRFIKRSMTT